MIARENLQPTWRISPRWLLAAAAVIVIGFTLICGSVLLSMRRGDEKLAHQTLGNLASGIDADIARNIELYDLSMRNVAANMTSPELAELSRPVRQMVLFDHAATARHFGAIRVLDAGGNVTVDSSTLDPAPQNLASEEFFTVHRRDPDGAVHTVLTGVTISNGLDWSPDGTRAFYNDTETMRVDVFDYDRDAGLTNRRPFVHIEADAGRPDGLTVDSEGGVWVALHRGGAVRRYNADGTLDAVVELPVAKVTACTLGGEHLDQLYITTSREGLEPDEEPAAGSLFAAEVGVRGQPVRPFAG